MEVVRASAEPPPTEEQSNRRHSIFRAAWYASNVLLLFSILLASYSVAREYSTRRYLKGFSDAVVPESSLAQEKIEAILDWMAHGPARQKGGPDLSSPDRNPSDTLNYASLLQVCGSATNAFINLADSAGLPARRLLLVNSREMTKHVVAEVLIDGRWIVADPAFRVVLLGTDGRPLTREELADPAVFSAATRNIPNYSPEYTYERTTHIRLARIGFIGIRLQRFLDRYLPSWEDSPAASLLLERESLAMAVFAIILVALLVLLRMVLRWYGQGRLGLQPVRVRERFRRACHAFLNATG